jgi:hypothetical protein
LLPLSGYGSQTLADDMVADVRDAMRAWCCDAATIPSSAATHRVAGSAGRVADT